MKLFSSSCGYLVLAMASSVTLTLATERYGDRKRVRHRNLEEDYPVRPTTNPTTNDTEEAWWLELTAKADKKYKAEKKDKADKKEKAEKATKLEKSTKLGKSTKKLHFDKLPKFAKHAKVDKESKLSKKDYFDTHAHDEEGSSPTSAPFEPLYPPINDDYFEEDFCPFDWIPIVNGTAECLQTFVDQTYIDLNVANALGCTESIEKALWHRYPVCFYLEYYEPHICNELFELADETLMCFENLYYSDDFSFYDDYYSDDYYYDDDYSYCHFDYMSENMPGCVYAFADAVGFDGESMLNCTVDFWEVYNKACYRDDDYYHNATCIAYEECQSIANSFDYCPEEYYYYVSDGYNSNSSVNLTEIVQAQMNVSDIWPDIYSGSISPGDILEALDMYSEPTTVSEWVWSKVQQCVLNYVGWLTDDFCYMQEELELTGGCVEAFADTIGGGLDVDAILTCELDYWTVYYDNCDYSGPYDERQNIHCQILDTCRNILTVVEDCLGSTTGYDLSDHMDEWQSDPELGGLLAAIYNGTVMEMDALGALQNYAGDWSTSTGWSDFIVCLDRFFGYYDDYYHMDDYSSMDDYNYGMDDPFYYTSMPYPEEEEVEQEESGGM